MPHRRIFSVFLMAATFGAVTLSAQQQPAPAQTAPATQAPAENAVPVQTVQPPAQQQQGQAEDTAPVIRATVNEVNLIFTVTDRHGHFIPNLRQNDFALLDDQKAPAKVTSFRQQTNLPLRVGILIDTSSSIRRRFEFEQQAAADFLLQIVKSRADRAFIMGFDVTPSVTQDWTNDLDHLSQGVSKLRPGGGTALFDAVYTACRDKLLDAPRQEPVRRAMVLVSDGDDDQSRVYMDEAVKMCQRSETIIYAISTNWTPSRGKGDDVLTKMTQATGGQVFFPVRPEDISNSFHDIEEELRSQYALTYAPADFKADGAFRTIYLFALDRKYQVRVRKGYFAPKQ